jgi:hypothetical protein
MTLVVVEFLEGTARIVYIIVLYNSSIHVHTPTESCFGSRLDLEIAVSSYFSLNIHKKISNFVANRLSSLDYHGPS